MTPKRDTCQEVDANVYVALCLVDGSSSLRDYRRMIELLFFILVLIIIGCVILYVAKIVIAAIPGAPKPVYNLLYALIALILLFVFLNKLGWVGDPHGWRMYR